MKKLFEEYPYIESGDLVLCKLSQRDVLALEQMAGNERVYKYLPTFLYEQKYDDMETVLERMDEECFETGESILLGIYLKDSYRRQDDCGRHLVGIAEIYNYEEEKAKASIGCRLDEPAWGKGIATKACGLLKNYLMEQTDIKTITAHIMKENQASAGMIKKLGFLCKYPDIYGDWGSDELTCTDKYVFKKEWLEYGALITDEYGNAKLKPVEVEQFVMAYGVEQDRIRAILPEGFVSLRPVLRINTEIRDEKVVYVEFNTPVEADGRRGWLNIDNWKSSKDDISFNRENSGTEETVIITAPFLKLTYTKTGIEGGCPAEKDNDGCYYLKDGPVEDTEFRPAEKIESNKEFCDCEFAWSFDGAKAFGKSKGKTVPAFAEPEAKEYPRAEFTAANAAAIPCRQVLGAYVVRFERYAE